MSRALFPFASIAAQRKTALATLDGNISIAYDTQAPPRSWATKITCTMLGVSDCYISGKIRKLCAEKNHTEQGSSQRSKHFLWCFEMSILALPKTYLKVLGKHWDDALRWSVHKFFSGFVFKRYRLTWVALNYLCTAAYIIITPSTHLKHQIITEVRWCLGSAP
jgi:hypothetical protein